MIRENQEYLGEIKVSLLNLNCLCFIFPLLSIFIILNTSIPYLTPLFSI